MASCTTGNSNRWGRHQGPTNVTLNDPMSETDLSVTAGQSSEAGIKPANEDCCGIFVPDGGLLISKGVAAVIADGVSGSEAGKEASNACVQGFLSDYFSTPESWTVKTSGQKVLTALNSWLYGQSNQVYGTANGLVTTLSILVIKSATAHLFHVGDTRIYCLRNNQLECLTRDHRVQVAGDKNYLSRAMGIELNLEIDYRSFDVEADDIFLLTTDGVHDFITNETILELIQEHDLERCAKSLTTAALDHGSNDNVTCQLLRIDKLPEQSKNKVYQKLTRLPFPPPLSPGMVLDGYRILRELHASKRSELFLVVDEESNEQLVLKAPSVNYEDDPVYIDRFLHEEWVGKRLDSPHVLKIRESKRKRQFLYCLTEYLQGQTLRQWMHDHPQPTLTETRNIIEQVARGLRAFHRREMIHQDLKPENIMIDANGTVKIIDFGSTKIAGIEEIASPIDYNILLGTENYTAPEYIRGERPSNRSDIFSLGVIAYEILTGNLPYGEKLWSRAADRFSYTAAEKHNPDIPVWVDGALKKATHPDPEKRYDSLSEFLRDLSQPNPRFLKTRSAPLMERNPLGFWRGLAILLALINIILFYYLVLCG